MLGGSLPGISPAVTTAWRVVFVLLAVGAALAPQHRRSQIARDVRRIVRSPWLILLILVTTTIMWFQLWVFMWAPANQRTQEVALGYFLLPLVMVMIGRFIFGDRLTGWQRAAVISASVGVVAELAISRSLGWPVLLVAGLYPVYFALRRWFDLDRLSVFFIEIALLMVPASVLIVASFTTGAAAEASTSWAPLLTMAALSGIAMMLYILASQRLTLGLFGLLSYLEPVLLLGAALVLGESMTSSDVFVYGPIALALLMLSIGTWRHSRASRRGMVEPPL